MKKILLLFLLLSVLFLTGMNRYDTTAGLVQDGMNLIADGTFDTACGVNWICGVGWTIADGVATDDGTIFNSNLIQNYKLVIGKTYLVKYEIKSITNGVLESIKYTKCSIRSNIAHSDI